MSGIRVFVLACVLGLGANSIHASMSVPLATVEVMPAPLRIATNADGIAAIVKRIGVAADIVVKNAQKPRPTITEVASSASNLALIVASLDTAIKRDPSEAREHVDVLKRIAEDEYNLGLAILGAVGMDDSNDGAAVLIEQIGALAESIYDSASEY